MARRQAFGLIELLVVVALIAILIGMLAPAIARVRVAAVQTQTRNNLKMCALAAHGYHDANRRFPDAYAPGGQFAEANKTLWFHLLPYVEQAAVYQKDAADTNTVAVYLAPDDPYNADTDGRLNFAGNIRVFGFASYPQANEVGGALKIADPKTKIVSKLSLVRIPDGTSNTVMFATRMASCDRDSRGKPIPTTINGDPGTASGGFFGGSAVKEKASPLYASPPTMTFQMAPKDFDDRPTGESVKCINAASGVAHTLRMGGLNAALCDGSVRAILPAISPLTFGRALCPGDGFPLGQDWNDE